MTNKNYKEIVCDYFPSTDKIFLRGRTQRKKDLKDFEILTDKYKKRSGMKVEIVEYEIKD